MEAYLVWIWLGALLLFLALEAVTAGLTSVWFALGALVSLIAAAFHAPLWLQLILFLVVSAVSLVFTRPLARKYLDTRHVATNADRIIGSVGLVTEAIDNLENTGAVRINGKVWTARSLSGESIPAETKVCAQRIDGVKLIVTPVSTQP